METFTFGSTALGDTFTNRTKDIQQITQNFKSGISTIVISPRRWGKTSLIHRIGEIMKNEGYIVCELDLFKCRTEEDFYTLFVKKVLEASTNKMEEWFVIAKEFLGKFNPKVGFEKGGFSIELTYKGIKQTDLDEILNLPQKIATKKNKKLIVCVDEFQNLEYFSDPLNFQKQLRANWQHHTDVTYCLYGSKRHLMASLFRSKSMPFYKFGDLYFLEKIARGEWVNFIKERFQASGKTIAQETAEAIPDLMENHSYYVQQLAYYVWIRTNNHADQTTLEEGLSELINRNRILYQLEFENLSNLQVNLVKALASGVEDGFTKKEVIQTYELSSSANVTRLLEALEKKEIIDRFTGKVEFIDPSFKIWLQREIID